MDQTERFVEWASGQEVFLNPRWPKHDFEKLMDLAKWAIRESNLDNCIWLATSGSSVLTIDQIKLVGCNKAAFLSSAQAVNAHLQCDAGDCWGGVLPIFHVGGLAVLARAYLSGSKVVMFRHRWDTIKFIEFCKYHSVSLVSLVPTQLFDLVVAKLRAPSSIRAVLLGGSACSDELLLSAKRLGWPVLTCYGMTETCSQIAAAPLDSAREFQVPQLKILPHVQVRVESSKSGRLQVFSSALLSFYAWIKDEQKYLVDPKENGWFTTEDHGFVDSDGFLTLLGRESGYFKIGGESTSLNRLNGILESILLELGGSISVKSALFQSIKQAATIISIATPRLENQIALVVTQDYFTDWFVKELVENFRKKVLPFEQIRDVFTVKEIPHTSLGKVQTERLREILKRHNNWG